MVSINQAEEACTYLIQKLNNPSLRDKAELLNLFVNQIKNIVAQSAKEVENEV